MNSIPWRVQLGVVAAGYVAVLLMSAALIFQRHLVYLHNAADAAAAGGMYAGGDLILAVFIGCMFCVPTFLLIFVIRKSESASILYAQVLLGISLMMPICLGAILVPAVNQGSGFFGMFCLYRLLASPLIIFGLVTSWLLSRFPRAKRLILYALAIEAGTLIAGVVIFLVLTHALQGLH